ncbi:2-oxoglutarate dehydrogenase E1 component [Neolewinella lacunae]|uniref:oxoglutarate dehydrogenase (succinyl-transferring) n=1 Tax=Neolewinella lacunae TaxID=1517758 RepID=A0A923PQH6_9BACT|nr:2-oxoglutarate dehydrogenase E1 component [Neolewinella lacunae]MBC6995614.1 2-oxoglutarate dehydrogenase E1 component [Neolewinella lacunae]MDN3635650.1 2-oxoglutarate dehydrogenase E1 component [Neolewinella lacunae]
MSNFSHISNAHPSYIENLYEQFSRQPDSVDSSWRDFFLGFNYATDNGNGTVHANGTALPQTSEGGIDWEHVAKELKVFALIKAYRVRGHMDAAIDPINEFDDPDALLELARFELSEADLGITFKAAEQLFLPPSTLQEIINHLRKVYLGSVGFEFDHIFLREKRRWLRTRIEQHEPERAYGLSAEDKTHILGRLNDAVGFEDFLKTKYVAQKRFGLEGGESTIVGLDTLINKAAGLGVEEVVIGMAHRGRLNVLANIMGKSYESIFQEFEGVIPEDVRGDGDVKYHMGYSSIIRTRDGHEVNVKLAPNPSHLEAVNPVVEGFARAKADMLYGNNYERILPILIHGDAAAAGQGIMFETAQMSELEAYKTGGTIHFIINNQIGFTTDYKDARTSIYASGVAAVTQSPVFHVNGDDPEAVLFVSRLAVEYRNTFKSDVYIDMLCYRKHGHNEGDDPGYTQPGMYEKVRKHPDVRKIYIKRLVERGDIAEKDAKKLGKDFNERLQGIHADVKNKDIPYRYQPPEEAWRKLESDHWQEKFFASSPTTGVALETVKKILRHLVTLPSNFTPVAKVNRLYDGYQKAVESDQLDWALAELTAYATLLLEGHNVRMSGQDVRRGTFSHRHAVLTSEDGQQKLNRLDGMEEGQGKLHIFNSLLSEFAVLGFEYGYATASPDNLVVWEAQFGDFANGAMTIFDQFVVSGESKWSRMNGLTVLLPHGYEGQGPEHSSARLERFLQLCAEYNMVVANVTMPANFFHLLRRQLKWNFRKPLVVMSPKSGLRHPMAVSAAADFGPDTRFQEIIDDPTVSAKGNKKIKRLLLCSGKVYFDLAQRKEKDQRDDVAIVRFEQLFPLPTDQVNAILKRYEGAEVVWVQEESRNSGAWSYISEHFLYNEAIGVKLRYIGRPATASPATGYKKVHDKEQAKLLDEAFA